MDLFEPHPVKLKAWNVNSGLMMRLSSVQMSKGQLESEGHVLLLFTGSCDQLGEEIYDRDLMLRDQKKYCIVWSEEAGGWVCRLLEDATQMNLTPDVAKTMKRLGSLFELGMSS